MSEFGSLFESETLLQPGSSHAGDTLEAPQKASKDIRRQASAKAIAKGVESVNRARSSVSIANDLAVVASFNARGITDVVPRENVFTFNGWKALGRYVRKGEHGVRLTTWVPVKAKDSSEPDADSTMRAVTTYVFHVSQTEAYGARS